MNNLRKYGNPPYVAALIHGGPGAAGDMAPVAKELSSACGILEPLQTADSIEGQLDELKAVLQENAELPLVLAGHSWGAWLAYIFAARYPEMVKKLILIGSGPFESKYAEEIMPARFARLEADEKLEALMLIDRLNSNGGNNKDDLLARFGKLMSKSDTYDPLGTGNDENLPVQINWAIHDSVWLEASKMRESGTLLSLAHDIRCPVLAIHGDFDPHPLKGVEIPLSQNIEDFRLIVLENCGHYPWKEKKCRESFFQILKDEFMVKIT